MKKIYLVYAIAVPTQAATHVHKIGECDAIIFVDAQSQEAASTLAHSALMDFGYHVTNVLSISVPSASAVSQFDTQLKLQYQNALYRGCGFELIAQALDQDHPLEVHSLNSPIIDVTKKH